MPRAATRSGPHLAVASIPTTIPILPPAIPRVRLPRAPLGVVAQVREATRPRARLASTLGFALGGFVPLATYVVAHGELGEPRWSVSAVLVGGGLLFSAKTVFGWGRLAFASSAKAFGFVVLLEGVIVTSHTPWLAASALAYLIGINGVATACALALGSPRRRPFPAP